MGTSGTQLGRTESGAVEHRRSPRRRVADRVSIELPVGKRVWLHDLSEGGLSILGSSGLDVGTSTSVRFQSPETDSLIDATGVIAWKDGSGRAGFRFTRVQPDSQAALRRWIQSDVTATQSHTTPPDDSVLESRIASLTEISELQADISSRQLDRDAALDLIVRRMIELTRASGAAVALREGEEVVCRASAGNAPDVGVKLSLSSLSGECFRTGAMVLLSDSESDPRVDPIICRQLSFRSLLVLPVISAPDVVGIAEVLSPNPGNFEGGDVLVLSFLCDLIADLAAPPTQKEGSHSQIDILEAADEEVSLASSPLPEVDTRVIAVPAAITELQEATSNDISTTLDEVIARPIPHGSEIAPRVFAKAELNHATVAAPALEIPKHVPSISAPERSSHSSAGLASTAVSFPVMGEQAHEATAGIEPHYSVSSERRGLAWSLSITAALIGLLVSVGLLVSRRNTAASVSPTPSTVAPSPSTSSPVSSASTSLTAAVPAVSTITKASSKPVAQNSSHTASEPAKPQQLGEASAAAIRVIPGESAKHGVIAESAPEAPQITQLSGGPLNTLPASVVSAKTPNPQLQVVQSQGVTGGKLLKRVLPRYPDEARRAGISGDVVLTATIGTDGILHNLKVITGSPVLREEALAAARQWRYAPAMLSGKAVETDTRITISFHHQ